MKRDPSGYWNQLLHKGESDGHPFRGNQYTEGRGAGEGDRKLIPLDPKFIREVARDYGHNSISDEDVKRAHREASKYNDPQDYYDRLKEFFAN